MRDGSTIVVLEGDQTGQELARRVPARPHSGRDRLRPDAARYDLRSRVAGGQTATPSCTKPPPRSASTASASRRRPSRRRQRDDVGSPNRILREEIGGKVIVRTGRRIPGVVPLAGVYAPISIVRMAVGDAYGATEWREGEGDDEVAFRTERIERRDLPRGGGVRVPAGRADRREGLRRPEVHREPDVRGDAQGRDGRRGGASSRRALRAAADRRDVCAADLDDGRAARDPGAQPRRRHPLRPRAAAVRLDRRLGVAARRVRRGLRAGRDHGGGSARDCAVARRARTSRTRWR